MKLEDAVAVFKTKAAIADALHIRPQNVAKWRDTVPAGHRVQLVLLAEGKLKASPEDIATWREQRSKLAQAIRLAAPPVEIEGKE